MTGIKRRARPALAVAAGLTLLLSQTASAITWSPPTPISESGGAGAWRRSTTVTDLQNVHVVYSESGNPARIYYRRSADGGLTWQDPVELSRAEATSSYGPSIRHAGRKLDVVWLEVDAAKNYRIWYRSSPDAGTTWTDPMPLSPIVGDAGWSDVARIGSVVVVAWTEGLNGTIYLRKSTDGGQTFGTKRQVASTANRPYEGVASYDGFVSLAFSGGGTSLHISWKSNDHTLRTRRSMDRGGTWAMARTLATNTDAYDSSWLWAEGRLFIAYTSWVGGYWRATTRVSFDRGANWKPATTVGGRKSFGPLLAYNNGLLRLAFERCNTDCSTSATYYRTSLNIGGSWSTPLRVSPSGHAPYAWPVGVGALESETVVVYRYIDDADAYFVYARTTQ